MRSITIYTVKFCPYCIEAKILLDTKAISYKEVYVNTLEEKTQLLLKSGMKTLPQIYINDICIGGYDDLYNLYNQHKANKYYVETSYEYLKNQ